MISQQINYIGVQSAQSAQVSFGGHVNSTGALSNVTSGLIGSRTPAAQNGGSWAHTGVELTGSMSNLLGSKPNAAEPATQQASGYESTWGQALKDRADQEFINRSPLDVHAEDYEPQDGSYEAMLAYAEDWTNRGIDMYLGENGPWAHYLTPEQTSNGAMNFSASRVFADAASYEGLFGQESKFSYYPSCTIQGCNPPILGLDGSVSTTYTATSILTTDVTNYYPDYTGMLNSIKSGAYKAPEGTSVPGFNEVANPYEAVHAMDFPEMEIGYQYDSQVDLTDPNNVTNKQLAAFYPELFGDGVLQLSSDNGSKSAVAASSDLGYSDLLAQYNDMIVNGPAGMAGDYLSVFNELADASVEQLQSPDSFTGPTVAMSTSELVQKYNNEMTDGVLSLDEMRAMYDKAFSSRINTTYMA